MLRRIVFCLPLALLFAACGNDSGKQVNAPAQQAVASKHSRQFISSTNAALVAYDSLSEAFVRWDSLAIISQADKLGYALDSMKNDPQTTSVPSPDYLHLIGDLHGSQDITAKRKIFNELSLRLFDYLKKTSYDATSLYLHECTMPYNDTGSGVWISKKEEGRNPYLGLHHPYYKGGMISCGSIVEELKNGQAKKTD